ncbi:MAG TPA: hypothetical protein PKE69_26905, partial [Pyrinomonadaceae bacterium]|nr:hypothetical protein [Pyrinomonadaceae bacterium]
DKRETFLIFHFNFYNLLDIYMFVFFFAFFQARWFNNQTPCQRLRIVKIDLKPSKNWIFCGI